MFVLNKMIKRFLLQLVFCFAAVAASGDSVYSYDTITGVVSQNTVTNISVLESNYIRYLTFEDEDGKTQTIETTDAHPFWVVTDSADLERAARGVVDENGVWLYHENIAPTENGFWVETKDLKAGDVFIGANGELSTLVNKERVEFPEGITVYNFTVDENHDYFVIAKTAEYGQTSILVHNAAYDLVGHHTIPKQIQKSLPLEIASSPLIKGVKGNPNIKYIPEWLHKAIHTGGNGGAYNARFFIEIEKVKIAKKGELTVEDILRIRNSLVLEFGL